MSAYDRVKAMPFFNTGELPRHEVIPGFSGAFVHTETMTFAYWSIEQGAELPEHAHENEQVTQVVEGRFEMTIDGETRLLSAGDIAVIPSSVNHSGRAMSPCKVIDTFQPARLDYRKFDYGERDE